MTINEKLINLKLSPKETRYILDAIRKEAYIDGFGYLYEDLQVQITNYLLKKSS